MKKFILVLALGISVLQVFADGSLSKIKVVNSDFSVVNDKGDELSLVNDLTENLSIIVLDASGNPVGLHVIYNSATNTVSFGPNQNITPQLYTIIITNNKTKAVQIYRIQVL